MAYKGRVGGWVLNVREIVRRAFGSVMLVGKDYYSYTNISDGNRYRHVYVIKDGKLVVPEIILRDGGRWVEYYDMDEYDGADLVLYVDVEDGRHRCRLDLRRPGKQESIELAKRLHNCPKWEMWMRDVR